MDDSDKLFAIAFIISIFGVIISVAQMFGYLPMEG